jgi:hypothetical protein
MEFIALTGTIAQDGTDTSYARPLTVRDGASG